MSALLSPIAGAAAQFFDNQGVILSGGLLYTYQAGSTTPMSTWTDTTQAVANANPIQLNSAGRPPNEIWLATSNSYKFVLATSTGAVLGTWDNIQGIVGTSGLVLNAEWVASGLNVTYASASSFTAPGDQRKVFPVNRRVQYFLTSGTYYGYVSSVSYDGTATTTVNIIADSTGLDSSLMAVSYALLNSVNPSVPQQYLQRGQPIDGSVIGSITPEAGTFTTLTSNNVVITGGIISGVTGFSVPDYIFKSLGVI
jgi:hypothetical protein